ncbi:NIPSNAP family protein [Pseudoxanthomonas putridarboris]|uniref:NIPSNAP family protein n=1 Tax=Pseudoxanthomonas putridarboris TaxID=752605 RepID=A0ABU9J5C4_9GAMM
MPRRALQTALIALSIASRVPRPVMRRLSFLVLLCACLPGVSVAQETDATPIHQLRIYEIFDDTKGAFHDRFRDHAARIMARHGFRILGMWETRHGDRTEFVYLLEWPDEAAQKAGWAAFMADREWSDIKARTRVHGEMVGDIEDRTLVPVPYSPALRGPE